MNTRSWGSFKAIKTTEYAEISENDIVDINALPSERGSFSLGGRVTTNKGDYHIKMFFPSAFESREAMDEMCEEEAEALIALNGADGHAPRLHMMGVFTDVSGRQHPALIMDRIDGINLYEAHDSGLFGDGHELPDGKQTAEAALAIARAIKACSDAEITHRDLWPANILCAEEDPSKIVFIDFGNATNSTRSTATVVGTQLRLARQNYGAPEVFSLNQIQRRKRNAPSVDVWSLGALIFFIRTGADPMGCDPATGLEVDPAAIDRMNPEKLRYLADIKSKPLDLIAYLEEHQLPITETDRQLSWLAGLCTQPKPIARPNITDIVEELEMLSQETGSPDANAEQRQQRMQKKALDTTPILAGSKKGSIAPNPAASMSTPLLSGRAMDDANASATASKRRSFVLPVILVIAAALIAIGGFVVINMDHDLANAQISDVETSYEYTGSNIEPRPYAVSMLGFGIVDGDDYKASFHDCKNAGTATILLEGIEGGSYFGTRTYQFEITPADIADAKTSLSSSSFTRTGKAIKPGVTITWNGKKLAKGTDYKVSYKDNVEAGNARVTIEGVGNFQGTITKKFTITKPAVVKQPTYYAPRKSSGKKSSGGADLNIGRL